MKLFKKILLATLFALVCNNVFAAASVLQESPQGLNGSSVTSQASTAFSSNATLHSTIEALVESPGVAPTSCSDGVNSGNYTLKVTLNDAGDGQVTLLYVFQNNASATKIVVTCIFPTSTPFLGVWTKEIGGVAGASYQTNATGLQGAPGIAPDAMTTAAVTPTSQPALLSAWLVNTGGVASIAASSGTGFTAGTTGFGAGGPNLGTSESRRVTSTSAIPATFTNATDGGASTWSSIVAVYTEAGASGSNGTLMMRGIGANARIGRGLILAAR